MKKALRSVYDVAGVCARRVTTLVTIVVAVLCSAGSVAAQTGPVAGRVIDAATRNPIVGAQIVVDGTQRGTLTDARGRFRIEGVPGTQIVLRAVMVGYRTGTEPARVGSTTVEIGLHEA